MMKEQITALLGVFTHPKQTMQALPSRRLYVLAILAPLYFGIARAFRPRNHALLYEKLGGNIQIVLFVMVIAIISIPLGAWLMRQFLKLFRKRLSVVKILNINGYAYVPRLVVAIFGYIVMFSNPSVFAADRPSPALVAIIVLGLAGMIYALFLMIYGFIVSPSEIKAGPIEIETPLARRPSHTTNRTDRVVSGSAANDRMNRAGAGAGVGGEAAVVLHQHQHHAAAAQRDAGGGRGRRQGH